VLLAEVSVSFDELSTAEFNEIAGEGQDRTSEHAFSSCTCACKVSHRKRAYSHWKLNAWFGVTAACKKSFFIIFATVYSSVWK